MITDDRLRLVFTCCHPALAREAQVALTLRLVCGLTTAEIARAFLVPEPTMAARVTRAKKKIAAAHIPYRVPGSRRAARTGWTPCSPSCTCCSRPGTRRRPAPTWCAPTWSTRALDLARMLRAADARRAGGPRPARAACCSPTPAGPPGSTPTAGCCCWPTRTGDRWDRGASHEGLALVARRCTAAGPGRFGLQAAIAARARRSPRRTPRPAGGGSLRALRRPAARVAVAGRRAQPGGRAGRGRRPGGRPRRGGPARPPTAGWPATGTCPRPGPTCCAGWVAAARRPRRTTRR